MSDYIIQSGDNLSRIAKVHGTTIEEIMKKILKSKVQVVFLQVIP